MGNKARGWTDAVRARYQWILTQTAQRKLVSVLEEEFVDAYINEFSPRYEPTAWGAHRCSQLGRDLANMYKSALLDRGRIGVSGGPGFPKWIWVYQLGSHPVRHD